MQSKYLIYSLTDVKLNKIIYVGKSSTGLKRPYSHVYKSSVKAVRDYANSNSVDIAVLEYVQDKANLHDKELNWIRKLNAEGQPLLNKAGIKKREPYKTGPHSLKPSGNSVRDAVIRERIRLGLTQAQAIKEIGLNKKIYLAFEQNKGNLTLNSLDRILEFYKLKLAVEPRYKELSIC